MITGRSYPLGAPGPAEPLPDPDAISDAVDAGRLVWVDVVDPTPEELTTVAEEFSLHPLALEDARKHGQRPKLEHYPTHAFLVAYSAGGAEVDLFVGPTWLVTVRGCGRDGTAWSIDPSLARVGRVRAAGGVGDIVYVVLDDLVDAWFDATDGSEDRLEQLEERIFADRSERGGERGGDRDESAVQEELFELRRDLLSSRRMIAPMRELLTGLLRGDVTWLDQTTLVHLQDVLDHVLRVLDRVDMQRELLGNAVDAHLAVLSHRMNRVMKTMTAWGALLLGSTLIAGIYGMNFQHMPELGWKYGYLWALGLMATTTAVGLALFRRRDWM